jgi:hypothetical protein
MDFLPFLHDIPNEQAGGAILNTASRAQKALPIRKWGICFTFRARTAPVRVTSHPVS